MDPIVPVTDSAAPLCITNDVPVDKEHIKDISAAAISRLLQKTDMKIPGFSRDFELETRVRDTIQSWGLADLLRPHDVTGIVFANTAYRHLTDFEAKVKIALYSAVLFVVDEAKVLPTLELGTANSELCVNGPAPETSFMGRLMQLLHGMSDHYPRFAASYMLAATLQFINVCVFDDEMAGFEPEKSMAYLEWRRAHAASTEQYAFFIWEKTRFPDMSVYVEAIPDVGLITGYLNDILSFYKEELAGEVGNYISDRARICNQTNGEIFQQLTDDVITVIDRVRHTLGNGEAREAFEHFIGGYISFHIYSPRYRLREILGVEYLLE